MNSVATSLLVAALSSSCFFFFLVCASAEEVNCASSCGSITNIRYPFRLPADPINCGIPQYELICQNNRTLVNVSSKFYYVKDISYENQTVTLIDPGLQSNNCSSSPKYSLGKEDLVHQYWSSSFNKIISYVTCKQPVENDDSYITTSPCINSTSNEYHYVRFEETRVVDAREYCTYFGPEVLAHDFTIDGKASYYEIWVNLLLGFHLTWRHAELYLYSSSALHSRNGFLQYVWEGVIGYILVLRGAMGVLCLLSFVMYKLHKQRLCKNDNIELFLAKYSDLTPTRYSYGDIKKITQGFKTKLGQGGFGNVFKGVLYNGRLVAIKILNKSRGNGEEFINEVATIGRIHHVNVVRLIGFCFEGSKRALIYDYMSNGSLDKYIYSRGIQNNTLDLTQMHEIALGIAKGIEYLHHGCEMQILHFDIKPHNILLDANFTPKVSDFGLAKLHPIGKSIISTTSAKGTLGFIAPELIYRNLGRISYKSDVYSFGRLLLEMIGKMNESLVDKKPDSSHFYFPSWLYDQVLKGEEVVIDVEILEYESTLAKKLVIVGLWCIQICSDDRPSMNKVVEMLEGNLNDLPMPPKPSLLFPSEIEEELEIECSEASYNVESSN